jgi:acetyl esterase/lipase
MLVIPGGGYSTVCSDREGEPIALAFLAKGYNTFVLNYRVGDSEKDVYPAQLLDACRAVLTIKENAERFNINPDRIFAAGFSAGGHLAGSLALLSTDKTVLGTLGVTADRLKIKGVVLCYPVVTALADTHRGSFERLFGIPFDKIPLEIKKKLSLEENVSESSPPAFIWHTAEDKAVPITGSLSLAEKYAQHGVPVSLHIYPYGCHGIALGDKFTNVNAGQTEPLAARWLDDSIDFLNSLK